jgi:hypothetical protein
MKCVILKNLFAIIIMKSFHYLNLDKPKIKSIEISTQDFLGIDKGVYNPHDITLYITYLHVMDLSQILCISLFMLGQ